MPNLILVDHDEHYFAGGGRFNSIIPLLRSYNFLDKYVISPTEIMDYMHPDNEIYYMVTARIPSHPVVVTDWLDGIVDEIPDDVIEYANRGILHIHYFVGEIIPLKARTELIPAVRDRLVQTGINERAITVHVPNFELLDNVFLGTPFVKYFPIFELSYMGYLKEGWNIFFEPVLSLNENLVQEINYEPRSKKYTCLNHIQKISREIVVATLFNEGLINDGYVSYHKDEPMIYHEGLNDLVDATKFRNHTPIILDTDDPEEMNRHWDVQKHLFNDAYWNFVTESFIDDYPVLTEKTYKPIANLQPFVMFGPKGSLAALKELGYRTFSPYIDESYDDIADNATRLKAALDIALKLARMTDEQHIALMKQMVVRLEHNQRVFLEKTWRDFI
jgi:hypothetical protein